MKRKKQIKYHELGATIILIQHFSFYSCVQININATAFHWKIKIFYLGGGGGGCGAVAGGGGMCSAWGDLGVAKQGS